VLGARLQSAAMREVRLVVMPYELGRLRDGVGRGPERLLEQGIEDALGAHGARVSTELVELDEHFSNEIDAGFELIRRVADRVRAATHDGAFPVVLSGSCFAAVGVVAGLDEPAPGVVWFDAHGDFNCPETTISGYFDGMGLAILTGGAWQGLLATVPRARPVPESAVVLAGARSLDTPETPRLEASAITWLPPASISSPSRLSEAIAAMDPAPTGVYLHVDLDVLDTTEAQVNIYSAPGGFSAAQLEALVSAGLARGDVRALSMTAYDPQCDVSDAVPPIARRLAGLVAEHLSRTPA
jgi:arginase